MTVRNTTICVPVLGGVLGLTLISLAVGIVAMMTLDFQHTVTLPANAPGLLRSTQWELVFWFVAVYLIVPLFLLVAASFRIADPKDSFWFPAHLVVAGIVLVVCIAAAIVLGIEMSDANVADNAGANLANDVHYPCVFANVGLVPPTNDFAPILEAPCDPAVVFDDLGVATSFLVFFIVSIVMAALAGLHACTGFMIGNGKPRKDDFIESNSDQAFDDFDEVNNGEDELLETQVRSMPASGTAPRKRPKLMHQAPTDNVRAHFDKVCPKPGMPSTRSW